MYIYIYIRENDQFVEICGFVLPQVSRIDVHTWSHCPCCGSPKDAAARTEERYAEFLAAVRRIMERWPYVCIPLCNGPLYRAIPLWKRNATGCRIHRPILAAARLS